jgi:hypothetical protein
MSKHDSDGLRMLLSYQVAELANVDPLHEGQWVLVSIFDQFADHRFRALRAQSVA